MKKFTLIEALIIIAIISILFTLLMPSLGKARDKAKQAICMSNQKQMSYAIEQHKVDNNLRLPKSVSAINGHSTNLGNNQAWKQHLNKYLNVETDIDSNSIEGVFACPSRLQTAMNMKGGYGWSNKYLPFGPTDSDDEEYQGYKLFDITNPDETIVIGDTVDNDTFHNALLWKHHGKLENIGDRHSGKINVIWADSHVSLQKQTTLLIGKNSKQHYYYLPDKINDN
ncbi:MAG: hypothetical protein NE334_09940 [Lentisphaeraceae bacterium]|nr:hypothetical protein [Lentisphaeraceae bacterium]